MATNSPSRRGSSTENGTILSINTSRSPLKNVMAVRASPPTDPRFDPTAPPFVGPGAVHNTGPPGLSLISQAYDPAEHLPDAPGRRHNLAARDQSRAAYEQNLMNHEQAVTPLPSAIHRLRPSLTPTRSRSPPRLPRPSSNTIQHSPPRRAFHEAVNASPLDKSSSATSPASRAILLRQHLAILQKAKIEILTNFTDTTNEAVHARHHLRQAWELPNANDHLRELYARDFQAQEIEKERELYGKSFKDVEEEIEELWAEIMVPHEEKGGSEGGLSGK